MPARISALGDAGQSGRLKVYNFLIPVSQINGIGAVNNGTLDLVTLPAGSRVVDAHIQTFGNAGGVGLAALTASLGRTSATFIDIIAAASIATTTVLGTASKIVTTAAQTVKVRFVATGATLAAVTGLDGGVRISLTVVMGDGSTDATE